MIAFSLVVLVNCGGGGGGGGTASTGTPGADMGGADDTNMPTETLPGYAVDAATARMRVSGSTEPTAMNTMTEMAIVTEIQRIATAADTFEFSDFGPTASAVTINCPNKTCSGNVPDVGTLTFSLAGIKDLSLVNGDMNLVDFDSDTEAVMVDRNVTVIQSQAAAKQSDETELAFQTYGGWLSGSVFGVELLDVTENDVTTSRFASFSFGKKTGSHPTGNDSPATWNGLMVGVNTSEEIIQGDVRIAIDQVHDPRIVAQIVFENIVNINSGSSVNRMVWLGITMETDGTFSSTSQTTGDINGAFYGTGGTEVGGTFNRDNIIGAFGAKK